jgi:hypothetical protein
MCSRFPLAYSERYGWLPDNHSLTVVALTEAFIRAATVRERASG